MKVTCFDASGMKCMNIHGETAEENALIRRLNVGVDQHRSDGSEERHIRDIKEDKYHDIADLAIPGYQKLMRPSQDKWNSAYGRARKAEARV